MEKERYHHGNVKKELIELAIRKLEDGIENLSIRELARELGISKNAPYRHFRSKDELLGEIANFGFTNIIQKMSDCIDENNSCTDNLKKISQEYLKFSRSNSLVYKLMFLTSHTNVADNSELEENGKKAFMVLWDIIKKGVETHEFQSEDPLKTSVSIWAYIHGRASFYIDHIGLPFNMILDEDIFDEELLLKGL